MSEQKSPKPTNEGCSEELSTFIRGGGCLYTGVLVAGIVATLSLGPIDFMRTLYNQLIGDTPVVKQKLVNYVRAGIARKNSSLSPSDLEFKTAQALNVELKGEKVDPQQCASEKLWDASEDYAHSPWQRYVWPDLDK